MSHIVLTKNIWQKGQLFSTSQQQSKYNTRCGHLEIYFSKRAAFLSDHSIYNMLCTVIMGFKVVVFTERLDSGQTVIWSTCNQWNHSVIVTVASGHHRWNVLSNYSRFAPSPMSICTTQTIDLYQPKIMKIVDFHHSNTCSRFTQLNNSICTTIKVHLHHLTPQLTTSC